MSLPVVRQECRFAFLPKASQTGLTRKPHIILQRPALLPMVAQLFREMQVSVCSVSSKDFELIEKGLRHSGVFFWLEDDTIKV